MGGGGEEGMGGDGEDAAGGAGAGESGGGEAEGGGDCQGAGSGEEAVSDTGDRGGSRGGRGMPGGVRVMREEGVGLCVAKQRGGDGRQRLGGGEAEVWGRGGGEAGEAGEK